MTRLFIILAGYGVYDSYQQKPVLALTDESAANVLYESLDGLAKSHRRAQEAFPRALAWNAPEREFARAFYKSKVAALLGDAPSHHQVAEDYELVWCPLRSDDSFVIERRAKQYEQLVSILGEARPALEALNAIDQIGIAIASDRADVVDALIASISKGQEWATGQIPVRILPCPVCEGNAHSRSARGRCRACLGTGRQQVKCRACVERLPVGPPCRECTGHRMLDPVQQRDVILKQHREWWARVTKMREIREPTDEEFQQQQAALYMGKVINVVVDGGERHRVRCGGVSAESLSGIDAAGHAWMFPFRTLASVAVDKDQALVPVPDTHPGPPERPTAKRGVVEREGGIRMYWDHELGNDATGIGTLEKPYATHKHANYMAVELASAARGGITTPDEPDEYVLAAQGQAKPLPATSPMPRAIAIALLRAQRRIKRVAKAARNEGDDYSYTSAETIVEEARGALLDEGLCVTLFDWDSDGGEIMVRWMYIHESGEQYIAQPLPMPIVLDGGRDVRAPDKALASALTYAMSQWLRMSLQIPRIGRSEDVDARSDAGRRARSQKDDERATLSTELNDAVLAMQRGIEAAKDAKSLAGIVARLEQAQAKDGLPEAVAARVRSAIESKRALLAGARNA